MLQQRDLEHATNKFAQGLLRRVAGKMGCQRCTHLRVDAEFARILTPSILCAVSILWWIVLTLLDVHSSKTTSYQYVAAVYNCCYCKQVGDIFHQ